MDRTRDAVNGSAAQNHESLAECGTDFQQSGETIRLTGMRSCERSERCAPQVDEAAKSGARESRLPPRSPNTDGTISPAAILISPRWATLRGMKGLSVILTLVLFVLAHQLAQHLSRSKPMPPPTQAAPDVSSPVPVRTAARSVPAAPSLSYNAPTE